MPFGSLWIPVLASAVAVFLAGFSTIATALNFVVSIHRLRAAYRMIFSNEGTLLERVDDAAKIFEGDPLVTEVIDFIQKPSRGTLMLPEKGAEVLE